MLRHEEQTTQSTGTPLTGQTAGEPASEVRVTAEEFARAVTRYQARREQAAQRMEGTVAIGDAVHELGLEATPEEILAEVQAERAAQEARLAQARSRPATSRTLRLVTAIIAAGALMLTVSGLFLVRSVPTTAPSEMAAVQIQTVTASPLVSVSVPPKLRVQDNAKGKPIQKLLSEVPDNVPVRCALELTDSRATFADFSDPDNSWTLVKHDGHVYVRGWIANMSRQAISASTVNIYSRKTLVPSGFAPTPITVLTDGFQTNPALGATDTIIAEHVQPSAIFPEKQE